MFLTCHSLASIMLRHLTHGVKLHGVVRLRPASCPVGLVRVEGSLGRVTVLCFTQTVNFRAVLELRESCRKPSESSLCP